MNTNSARQVISISFVIVFLSVLLVRAQIKPVPAIKLKVIEVPVDVVVLDAKNRPILDLRKKDFTILEDGVEQEVSHFLFQQFPEEPAGSLEPATKIQAASEFRPVGHRTILIMLGRGRHMWFDTIPSLIDFVEHELRPSDLVAVMAYNRATDFTTDHHLIASVLSRYREQSGEVEAALELRDTGLQGIYGAKRYGDKLQARIDSIFESARSRQVVPQRSVEAREKVREDRDALQTAENKVMNGQLGAAEQLRRTSIGSLPIKAPAAGPEFDKFERLELQLLTDMSFDEYIPYRVLAEQDMEHIFAAVQYLRVMEGEKHLIYLHNQGLVLPRMEHEKSLANLASDARVRLHAIQTGGTWVSASDLHSGSGGTGTPVPRAPGGAFPAGSLLSDSSFAGTGGHITTSIGMDRTEELAELTGGLSFTHEGMKKSLDTIDQTNRSSYLLGYVPKGEKFDGGFRRIEVKVNRPGAKVMNRRGYFAYEVLKPYDRNEFVTHARTAAALEFGNPIPDLPFTFETKPLTSETPGKLAFETIVSFVPTADVFKLEGASHNGKLAVSYFVISDKDQLLDEAWDDLQMDLKEETYQRVMAGGVHLHKRLHVPEASGNCRLKIVIYDLANDRLGSAEKKLPL